MKNYFLISAACLALSAVPAHAEDAKKPSAPAAPAAAKSAVDQNNDGVISKSEADAVSDRDFAAFDTDKNGKIGKDEFQALLFKTNAKALPDEAAKKKVEPEISAQFSNLDHDKSGAVEKAEFKEDSTRRFKAMDENGDGRVSKQEVAAVQAKIKAQIAKMKAAYEAKKGATAPAKK